MINLAGDKDCDKQIRRELLRAKVDIVEVKQGNTEVPYTIIGRLYGFEFRRAWYYWVAKGPMPLKEAKELYAEPVGREDIRVAGHCGCPPPEPPWVKKSMVGKTQKGMIDLYHIDTEVGLRIFTDKIRQMHTS